MNRLVVVAAGVAALLLSGTAALAGGDAAKGKVVFQNCAICHTIGKGQPNGVGPNLHGLFDREAGKAPGFSYSSGLATAKFKWDDENLDKWLAEPSKFIAGTKMSFNIPDAQDRANVIAYLHQAAQ